VKGVAISVTGLIGVGGGAGGLGFAPGLMTMVAASLPAGVGGVPPGRSVVPVIHGSRPSKSCSILVTITGTPFTSSRSTTRCFFSSGMNSSRSSSRRLGWSGRPSK
jgi:hypothetical protein